MAGAGTEQKQAMRVSAIRFGADLWRLLEAEAAGVGVSVSQYVREAALIRASAAAAARGEEPVDLLAEAGTPRQEHPTDPRAARAREDARQTRSEAHAVRAEAKQARRRRRTPGEVDPSHSR